MIMGRMTIGRKVPQAFLPEVLGGKWLHVVTLVPVLVVTLVSFLPVLSAGFLPSVDDGKMLEPTQYRELSLDGLKWMFTTFYFGDYQPFHWLSYSLDYAVWQNNPFGYHLTNLLLHLLTTAALYCLAVMCIRAPWSADQPPETRPAAPALGCAAGSLFFAVHPLRVEAVAWISNRANLLSGLFYVLTVLAYLKAHPGGSRPRRRVWLATSVVLAVCSLFSKSWGMTIPVVLLIIDAYPLRRFGPGAPLKRARGILLEKILFLLPAVVFAVLALRSTPLAEGAHTRVAERLAQSSYGLCFYLWKTVFPHPISPLYLLDRSFDPTDIKYVLCGTAVIAVTAWLVLRRRARPWALAAWALYVVIVSPVIGLVQSGPQLAAVRYTYLSCLPFALLLAVGAARLHRRTTAAGSRFPAVPLFLPAAAAVIVVLLSFLTFRESQVWHDEDRFWNRVISVAPDNHVAYFARGTIRLNRGDLPGARQDYDTSILLNPRNAKARCNRAVLRARAGDWQGALADYNTAIEVKPTAHNIRFSRGLLKLRLGDAAGALSDFDAAIRHKPDEPPLRRVRGNLRAQMGDLAGAAADYRRILDLRPNHPRREQIEQAIDDLESRRNRYPPRETQSQK